MSASLFAPKRLLLPLALLLGTTAGAQEGPAPSAIQALQQCRAIESADARLACYDAALDALTAELASGATIAVSRAEVEAAQRESVGLPSFSVPGLGRFVEDEAAADSEESEEMLSIRVVAATLSLRGALTIETDSGQRWTQVGSDYLRRAPETPFEATLKPAFGDTYFMSSPSRPTVRMRREK
jgi:hypothetical protein